MADDPKPTLSLVSNRPRPSFESFDRFIAQPPQYRQRALAPWQHVWDGGKVLSLQWADDGSVEIISYKPGTWERDLERHAAEC